MSTTDNRVLSGPRVVLREVDATGPTPIAHYVASATLAVGETVTVGRQADLLLGVDLEDDGVSRLSLHVTAQPDGWEIAFQNRNGATLQLWARAPVWVPPATKRFERWPRIGVRIEGNNRQLEHWVLLESDEYLVARGTEPAQAYGTHVVKQPTPLTDLQLDAVYALFEEHLAWPPVANPKSWPLDTAGRRLGVGGSAIRERLIPVQERAKRLGLRSAFSIKEPDYVFHLAARGYLERIPAQVNLPQP